MLGILKRRILGETVIYLKTVLNVGLKVFFVFLESFCCWLKNDIPPIEDYYLEGASVAGVVHRNHYRSPPTGMRSAVPLGGLAAGSFEMRADGEAWFFNFRKILKR